ncbi:hypothetical protein ACIPJG_33320 [Streptomyces halstedii]|uniref:hypothetical protein n=1 Tax=Streptomyces halstedii TaxID=1944 RepID=UPI00382D5AA6
MSTELTGRSVTPQVSAYVGVGHHCDPEPNYLKTVQLTAFHAVAVHVGIHALTWFDSLSRRFDSS